MASGDTPVLWHIPVSHYSEKIRWALDFKAIECRRLAPPPGLHMAIALGLTRGEHKTFPVLRIAGRNVGDSSAIIAALEEYRPLPPLYPDGSADRRRALELESFFDEHLGPSMRLLAWHELLRDPERLGELTATMLPAAVRGSSIARAGSRGFGTAYVKLRFRVAAESAAAEARADVLAALDRLEAELGDAPYLAGDRFSVADLTAASLFYPLVNPPEGPAVLPDQPPGLAAFRAPLEQRPGYLWVQRMFARHRQGPGAGSSGGA
jgi:glutathione S-transferase